jgi:hypothetical protein
MPRVALPEGVSVHCIVDDFLWPWDGPLTRREVSGCLADPVLTGGPFASATAAHAQFGHGGWSACRADAANETGAAS